jgi:competence protein ComEA
MPEIPISRRRALAYALLLLVVVVVAGRVLLPAGAARERAPSGGDALVVSRGRGAAAAPEMVVHVVGAVRRTGLYRLREGERVADAVRRAGGASVDADLAGINLAAPVADGLQIVVPARVEASAGGERGAASVGDGTVHLNTATLAELDALPGIGPVTAQKIIDFREEHGAFRSVDDLDAVPGIGAARLEQLRELVAP